MNEKRRFKKQNEKGITLLALIVTIIVLLILSGISIAMLVGDNGIITNAGKAKKYTDIAAAEEIANLAYSNGVANRFLSKTAPAPIDVAIEELRKTYTVTEAGAGNQKITKVLLEDSNGDEVETPVHLSTGTEDTEYTVTTEESGKYYVTLGGQYHEIIDTGRKVQISKTAVSNINEQTDKITVSQRGLDSLLEIKETGTTIGSEPVEITKGQTLVIKASSSAVTGASVSVQLEGTENLTLAVEIERAAKKVADATIEEIYGKPIDYDVDLGKNAEGNNLDLDSRPEYDWQIFYNDGTNIYIIAEDYVPLHYPTTSTNNPMMPTGINNNTSAYSTKPYSLNWDYNSGNIQNGKTGAVDIFGSGASSMTQYIANKYLSKWKAQTQNTTNSNARMTATLMDTSLWTNFANSSKVNNLTSNSSELVAIGGPTVEMWVDSWNQKHGSISSDSNKAQLYLAATATGYKIGTKVYPTTYYIDNSSATGYSDKLYYPRTSSYQNAYGYWLASPSDNGTDRVMDVSYGGRVTNGNYAYADYSVRPVVCLPSDITAEWNEEDNVWNIVKK